MPKKRRKDQPAGADASGCNPEMDSTTDRCARRMLSQQQDFWEQMGQLQEEVEAANRLTFYPEFHCELDFIERFWCAGQYLQYNEGLCHLVIVSLCHFYYFAAQQTNQN